MNDLAGLIDELKRSDIAREAMEMLEAALARRSSDEQGAFWRAVDLYYFSRKAPPGPVAPLPYASSGSSSP